VNVKASPILVGRVLGLELIQYLAVSLHVTACVAMNQMVGCWPPLPTNDTMAVMARLYVARSLGKPDRPHVIGDIRLHPMNMSDVCFYH